MEYFHRPLVVSIAVAATCASDILTVNRDNKCEILLAVSNKERKYRADRIAAGTVADIISKEKTTRKVSFVNKKVDIMQDVSMP